ncbi:hypothetical protein Tco_0561831 [Tanacetum coccineum]
MDDTRTMAQLLEAPTAGYEDAIVRVPGKSNREQLCASAHPRNFFDVPELKDMVKALLLDKKKSISRFYSRQSGLRNMLLAVLLIPNQTLSSHHWAMCVNPRSTKDMMLPTNNGSTEDVQPPVVPVVHHESISKPVNAPVSASRPNQKASIPFPSRRNDERRREKANDQIEENTTKSLEI